MSEMTADIFCDFSSALNSRLLAVLVQESNMLRIDAQKDSVHGSLGVHRLSDYVFSVGRFQGRPGNFARRSE